jgi:NAD(P)-dependent dehydrogenase (short-subunit alcohol dehydrogenase family)
MNPSYDFKGQVALVTGTSSGMGLATARAFAEAGAAVVLADINQAALTSVTEELTAAGHQVLAPCLQPEFLKGNHAHPGRQPAQAAARLTR